MLWPAYNVVRQHWADLVSVDLLSVDDVLDANEVLDAIAEAEATKP